MGIRTVYHLAGEQKKRVAFDMRPGDEREYIFGDKPPHYPLPAIPVHVGWQPHGSNRYVNRSYWWVCSATMLWTFWQGLGCIEERL